MVKVPTLDTPSESLKPTRMDPADAATLGGEIIDLSKGIGSIADHLQKVQDDSQMNKAQAWLITKFGEIHNKYANDSDLSTAPQRAQDDLSKAVDDASRWISNPMARDAFHQQGEIEKARKSTDMNTMFYSQTLKEARFNLFNAVDAKIKQAGSSTRPGQYEQAKEDITNLVTRALNNKYLHPEAASYYLSTHLEKLAESQVDQDMRGPGMAKIVNEKLRNGGYPDLKPDVLNKKIEESTKLIKRQENEQKEALKKVQSNNGNYLFTLSKQGQLTPQVIQEFGYSGRISDKEFKSWQKKYDSENINGNTDPAFFRNAIQRMTDPKNSIDNIREHLLDGLASDKLSKEDFQNLYEMHLHPLTGGNMQSVQNLYGKEQEYKDIMMTHKGFLRSALELIHKYFGSVGLDGALPSEESVTNALSRFVAKNRKNTTPEDYPRIANDVIKEQRILDNPEIVGYPEEGRTMQDENGNRANTLPDGGITSDERTLQIDNQEPDNASFGF